jgi:carbamoyl-phosphate synthase large subunit
MNEKNRMPTKALILGSGGLRIGQAGEFDYSGSQAIKALKEEGVKTVLVNPNIATVQTDENMADTVYLQPLNLETVEKIIEAERPDAILLNVGGQTALNLGIELDASGILKRYGIRVLGTEVESIKLTEDRELFKRALEGIGVQSPVSRSVETVEEALAAAKEIGYPLMLRAAFSLGGLGSGKIQDEEALVERARELFHAVPQILIEEYLEGWKEIEYEIMRDSSDNVIIVCNMENMDPMGIHTGESIVIAPSQTLNDAEFQNLRSIAIKVARELKIIGECNIQYALNPKNGDCRVIEVNARLSRSSALASKATGYPLAFVSTKVSLGLRLDEISNSVTKKTTAFFEPMLDYVVIKIPRWDIHKLKSADRRIGSEMKSVGEVMAIGRSFPEALQKAVRMLNIGAKGLGNILHAISNPEAEIAVATDRRLFALYRYFLDGGTTDEAHELSKIEPWFLHHLRHISLLEKKLPGDESLETLHLAKKMGFSDEVIASLQDSTEEKIRQRRIAAGIVPYAKQIDTLAGEFDAETNYLYCTYHAAVHDLESSEKAPVLVLCSGPYSIGSSVEFDWSAVNTARTLKALGEVSVLINSNPETVSTDYDESDRLYFEELSLERVRDIADFESPKGIIVSVGGQAANNLALRLNETGYPLLGTPADCIDRAENRQRFSALLNDLGIDQPEWEEVSSLEKAKDFAKRVGFPILLRPSYVLSGAAMNVVTCEEDLDRYLGEAAVVSQAHPVVISQFISNAKELEMDGIAEKGKVVIYAIAEHVENAGVHSGDATIVLPPQRLYLETIRQTKKITRKIVEALNITGPFNLQFIAKENALKVIECNVRASRSLPFVSKVTNYNFIEVSTEVLMGKHQKQSYQTLELDYIGVKTPMFSYNRLKGADPVAHVEMASTGEVATLGDTYAEAFFSSWLATEQNLKGKRILLSIADNDKLRLLELIRDLEHADWELFATEGTHDFLVRNGVSSVFLYKESAKREPSIGGFISDQALDLIVNIPSSATSSLQSDGYHIRRLAIDNHIPLITNLQIAQLFLSCLKEHDSKSMPVKSWNQYVQQ